MSSILGGPIAAKGGSRRRISENRATGVVALIPPGLTGDYKLEVVTQFSKGTLLKEPRAIPADCILTVS